MTKNRPSHLMSIDESERLDFEGLRAENRRLRDDLQASNAETDAAEAKVEELRRIIMQGGQDAASVRREAIAALAEAGR